MTGSRANVNIEPRKDGPTMMMMRFHELKEAPAGKRYVVWAVSPDNKYRRLGQVVNTGQRNEAEIKSEVAWADFGLFVTTEEVDNAQPAGTLVGTIIR
ncbi:MAG: anti-sigma factor [Pyrinomonadaceae bacterium]